MTDGPSAIRLGGPERRGAAVSVTVDGRGVTAHEGESVAGLLMAEGLYGGRRTPGSGERRGYYCGMGVCWDCVVVIDGEPNVRACRTLVRAGMRIETQNGHGPVNLP